MRRSIPLLQAELQGKSYFVPSRDRQHTLHLRRIRLGESVGGEQKKPVCLLFHGAIENGRIFYSRNNKGLAPFLARGNCDVFVADFRGRGESTPPIHKFGDHGQTELINDDVLALSDGVKEIVGKGRKQHWIAHSWGGILCGSALARYPAYADIVASQVWVGAKRTISVWNLERFIRVEIFWQRLFPLLATIYGYVPVKKYRLGGEDEPLRYITEISEWIIGHQQWKDTDGFDFHVAAEEMAHYPPTWSIAGQGDHVLGNPVDVLSFLDEHKRHRDAFKYSVLSKKNGNLHDYDHVNMLTHKDVERDHAPMILDWIRQHEQAA